MYNIFTIRPNHHHRQQRECVAVACLPPDDENSEKCPNPGSIRALEGMMGEIQGAL
jgi:hypothetical protein